MARKRPRATRTTGPGPKLVVMVGEAPDWQQEAETLLSHEGYLTDHVVRLDAVLPMLERASVQALLVAARPLSATDLLLLKSIRETSPRTAILVVTKTPTDPDIKRAFESGATAFLSWPASTTALRHAIDRAALLASAASPNPEEA